MHLMQFLKAINKKKQNCMSWPRINWKSLFFERVNPKLYKPCEDDGFAEARDAVEDSVSSPRSQAHQTKRLGFRDRSCEGLGFRNIAAERRIQSKKVEHETETGLQQGALGLVSATVSWSCMPCIILKR